MRKNFFDFSFFDENFRKLIKNSSWLLGRNFLVLAISLLQSIIIARWLGVENYGLLALTITYVTIINQLIDFRINEAVIKYVSEFWVKGDKEKCLATIKLCYLIDLSTGIIAFFVVILTANLAAVYLIHRPQIASLINLYALSLLFSTVNGTSLGILSVFDRFSLISFHSIFSAMTKFGIVYLFLLIGQGLRGVLFAFVLGELLGGIVLIALAFGVTKRLLWVARKNSKITFLKERFKEIGLFLINININESLTLITKNADIMFLGYFRNPMEVGYYRLAKNFVSTLSVISEPFYTVNYPAFSKMWSNHNQEGLRELIKRITILMSIIILPLTIVIFLTIPWIIKWTVGLQFLLSAKAVRIMIWGIVIGAIFLWSRPILLAVNRPDIPTKGNIVNAIIVVIFSLLLVPPLGYTGSAIVFVLPWVVGHSITVGFFLKNYWSKELVDIQT